MKHSPRHSKEAWIALFLVAVTVLFAACSAQKNTARSRFWQAFNANYNTYFNGKTAYIEGSEEKEKGNKDNFTEMIPLYAVGNKQSRDLGKAKFDRAIEKCRKAIKLHSIKKRPEWNKRRRKTERDIAWLNRKEYNPFLWKAWMLMGRSQFQKGDFDEAASTFAYMCRLYKGQGAIYGKARSWLMKCYVEQDWLYDAEDIITKTRHDSIHWRAKKDWDYAMADYLIRANRLEEAPQYLRRVIKHEMRSQAKARQWYLLGQIYSATGKRDLAYKAFRGVLRQHPPYELAFNARIAMTEVMAQGKGRQMIGRLKRMALSDNNKDYLDQVYYAIGNIYISQKDTLNAIKYYERGNQKSTRGGVEKGVLLLRLGDIYWQKEMYSDAGRCYGEAIGLLDKDRKDYEQLSKRSKVLDELVPYTDAVHLQDSLQTLATMPEKDRNAAIDRVIDALKRKEKEERKARQQEEAEQQMNDNQGRENFETPNRPQQQTPQQQSGLWYFYNPMAVAQGKATFEKLFGKRENVDDWQRVNKTVVALSPMQGEEEEMSETVRDSLAREEAREDSLSKVMENPENDPHKREYYMKDIPFTEEQIMASNLIIEDALFNAGVIFKDKLDNLPLSEKALLRLENQYKDFQKRDEALYHLYLLYARRGDMARADRFLGLLRQDFPESQWTVLLTDPYFQENARNGKHLEDSLYQETYEAFKSDQLEKALSNDAYALQRFPMGENRDKFTFIAGMCLLNGGNAEGCLEKMRQVVKDWPKSSVAPLAGMIVNGVEAGRHLRGGKFSMDDIWQKRSEEITGQDSTESRQFTAERYAPFSFIMAYVPDSVEENKLLYALAKHNFTNYMVRSFEIKIDDLEGIHLMRVDGFRSYDEALQYTRLLFKANDVLSLGRKTRKIIISDDNLALLGVKYSFKDYEEFHAKHFAPLKISTVELLREPVSVEFEKPESKEKPAADEPQDGDNTIIEDGNIIQQEENIIPEDGLYNGGVLRDEDLLDLDFNSEAPKSDVLDVVLPEEKPASQEPAPEKPKPAPEKPKTESPQPKPAPEKVVKPEAEKPKALLQKPAAMPQKPIQRPVEDTGIDFVDEDFPASRPTEQPQKKSKEKEVDYGLEDEYYELDGF